MPPLAAIATPHSALLNLMLRHAHSAILRERYEAARPARR